jgi:hypothetical protein
MKKSDFLHEFASASSGFETLEAGDRLGYGTRACDPIERSSVGIERVRSITSIGT